MKTTALTKCLRVLFTGLIGLSLLAGCVSTSKQQPASSKSKVEKTGSMPDESVLKVGVSTNAPPLVYKQGGEITGLEVELAREFAKFLGKSVQFVELDWKNQIPALLDKRTDIIMSGMSITKKREYRIAFSTPYFRSGQMAIVRRGDKNNFPTGYYGIVGQSPVLKIGVVRGTTGEQFVRKNFSQAKKISTFKTSRDALKALLTIIQINRIDILIHDGPILMMLTAEDESADLAILPHLLTEEYLAWGIRKNDVALLAAADQFVEQLKKEGRLRSMIQRWIPY